MTMSISKRWYPDYSIQRTPDQNFGNLPENQLYFSWRATTDMLAALQNKPGTKFRLEANDQGSPCITIDFPNE